jgi:hypothetical protein
MEIEIKITIIKVEDWSVKWNIEDEKKDALIEIERDIQIDISERCGIDIDNIIIESKLK